MSDEPRSRKSQARKPAADAGARPRAARAEDGAAAVLAALAAMPEPDRGLGERLHALITAGAPGLVPRLWYGMPAYARDGKVVCFFQAASKFQTRYATLGFLHEAHLDDGPFWPTAFALQEWTEPVADRIRELVTRAVR